MDRSLLRARAVAGLVAVVGLVAVTACSAGDLPGDPAPSTPTASPTTTVPPGIRSGGDPAPPSGSATPSSTPSGTASSPRPARPTPAQVSLPTMFEKTYDGRDLRRRSVLATTDAYTSYSVTYLSNGVTVSGKLDVPRGRGPFPALVLAHGYIDPASYVNGQGMRREQDWFARAGYVVLHTDYRNHAASDAVPTAERNLRLGYTTDVINAVHALRRTDEVPVAGRRVGLVGRSMGGGVVYNVLVTQPGLVDAAAVYAPVSSRTWDNVDRWIIGETGRSGLAEQILDAYGDATSNPRFWLQVSPRTYFSRITEPVLLHHGTADSTCPPRWSRATLTALEAAGVDARLYTYPGEEHAFIADWPLSMRRTTAFLRANL